ncbi:hypothetical protein IAU60_006136 [Kwoniella sp. DSM 27419]
MIALAQPCQALIVWKPTHLFLPPVQEPPPPTHVFRHVNLESSHPAVGGRRRLYFNAEAPGSTPDRISTLPQLFINHTFLQNLLHPLPAILFRFNHTDSPDPQPQSAESNTATVIELDQVDITPSGEDSMESIDETSPVYGATYNDQAQPLTAPVSHQTARKVAKLVPRRKTPEPTYSFRDVFNSGLTIEEDHDSQLSEGGRGPGDIDASIDQWRVGKMPGHQGSHTKLARRASPTGSEREAEDIGTNARKRTFCQSITSSAGRVLKKPFRPPSRISPKGKDSCVTRETSAGSSPSVFGSPLRTSPTMYDLEAGFPDFSTPPSLRLKRNVKLVKPFKPPSRADRSTAPSPKCKDGNLLDDGQDSVRDQINQVQQEILNLRKASKIIEDDAERELSELIVLWRDAGREVVERMFARVPKPEQLNDSNAKPAYTSWDAPDTHDTTGLTEEQIVYLRNAPRNADGEPVDQDGNLLIPDSGDEKDFWDRIDSQRRFGSSSYRPVERGLDRSHTLGSAPAAHSATWNYGALLRLMNVDPDLLGYDEKDEEWIDY